MGYASKHILSTHVGMFSEALVLSAQNLLNGCKAKERHKLCPKVIKYFSCST